MCPESVNFQQKLQTNLPSTASGAAGFLSKGDVSCLLDFMPSLCLIGPGEFDAPVRPDPEEFELGCVEALGVVLRRVLLV